MKRVLFVFATIFFCLILLGCENTAVNEPPNGSDLRVSGAKPVSKGLLAEPQGIRPRSNELSPAEASIFLHESMSGNYKQDRDIKNEADFLYEGNLETKVCNFSQAGDKETEASDFLQNEYTLANFNDPERTEPDDKPIDLAHLQRLIDGGYIEVNFTDGVISCIRGNATNIKFVSTDNAFFIFNLFSPLFNYTIKTIDDIERYTLGEISYSWVVHPIVNGVTIQDSTLVLLSSSLDHGFGTFALSHEHTEDNPFYDYLEWLSDHISRQ